MVTRPPGDPRLAPIVLRRELLAQGMNDRAIAQLVRDGTLHRLRYGSYVEAASWKACDRVGQHGLVARAVVKRAGSDVALSHITALGEWDVPLWDLPLDIVHLTRLDRRAGRREAGVIQHLGHLRREDVVVLNGVSLTSPTRTALDCTTVMDVEHGLVVVNDLLHRRLTTMDDLTKGMRYMTYWPGSLPQALVLQLADSRCGGSVGEGRTLNLIFRQGLPRPVPQYPIEDETGRIVAYVDFAWPELGVFLEFDGRIKYQKLLKPGESVTDVVLRERDRERLICTLTGWRCIRIAWSDLERPETTAALIRAELFPDGIAG
ncbi:MAG TPA: hypothetical protein VFV89_22395 [Nocardioides sp.]|uniref:hypothetical protein n=1 Tax=Nocardioides sp. TaxID=35761 RepID=UPI002E36A2C5|nr:hypothetical protein [Nocardioides sp.]HEX5090575.1 hypothetical protein [Nocardioides sp.]